MKTCKHCKEDKPLELFSIQRKNKDGHMHVCKQCFCKKYHNGKVSKKDGRLSLSSRAAKVLSRNPKPPVDREWYVDNKAWAIESWDFWHINFDILKYCPMEHLTVEYWQNRELAMTNHSLSSDYGQYLRTDEYTDEYRASVKEETKPQNPDYKNKSVIQMDLDGNEIESWTSGTIASEALGINGGNISACCRGKRFSVGGFRWKYA